jgi:hypothetical protein
MIWHIFKKDWKLEWRLALGVALVQLILSGLLWHEGPTIAVTVLGCAAFLARAFLIVETVHNDPIPGVRQDWLVRPILRSELLAAKILFTVLVVQAPVFAGDWAESLAEGFSFGTSLEAALSRSFYMLITFSLPVLAIASFTKNLLEVLASGVFIVAVSALAQTFAVEMAAQKLVQTGVGWMAETACLLVLSALVAATLFMQFRRRMTAASRWWASIGTVVLTGVLMIPWQPAAFALQSRLSSAPGAGSSVVVGLEANAGPIRRWVGSGGIPGKATLLIPVSVAGLPEGSIVAGDHYEMRVIDSQGVVRAQSQSLEYEGGGLMAGTGDHGTALNYTTAVINMEDYLRLKDQKVRVELTYSLTLMQLADSYALPATNGNERLPGFGWCRTHLNQLGDSIVLNCIQAGPRPDCYSQTLENTRGGRRDSTVWKCSSRDYSPYFVRSFPDSVVRFGDSLPFRDPMSNVPFEVDAADIGQTQVVVRNYRTLDHFTRTVTTPERLSSQWLAK